MRGRASERSRFFDSLTDCGPGFCRGRSACRKTGKLHRREGRVCAGNPGRVSCTIAIKSFQNVFKVLKTCSVCQKRVFDRLSGPGFCRGRFHFIIPALFPGTPEASAEFGVAMNTGSKSRPESPGRHKTAGRRPPLPPGSCGSCPGNTRGGRQSPGRGSSPGMPRRIPGPGAP